MFAYLFNFVRWILSKVAIAVLIVVLGASSVGLWLFVRDRVDFDQWRSDAIRLVNGRRTETKAALDDVNKRLDRIAAEITAEQERGRVADGAIAKLRELESVWDRLVGNPEQQKANALQLERLLGTRKDVTTRLAQLQRDFTRATWERDGLQVALGKLDAEFAEIDAQQSKLLHYLEAVWSAPFGPAWLRLPFGVWVWVFLAGYFLGPTLRKFAFFYAFAPWVERGRAVRLQTSVPVLPEVAASAVTAEVAVHPGERLWIKERFLQASDETLRRRTRALLDWRIPFTCFATGLVELIELAHDGRAGEHLVTLSRHGDPHCELTVVTLPEGASLILRPSFLAGVLLPTDGRCRIRRRWQLFRWQAWVTCQFRFFEFSGPCRLIVAGNRGVRAERLHERTGDVTPARRTNQDATIGFTPNLDYRPVRAETFWSYYRGMNPLFDDLFVGRGIFLCQQVAGEDEARPARRFWSAVGGGVLKLLGI
jgi:hypothetical protein